jgi:hypothetical protein
MYNRFCSLIVGKRIIAPAVPAAAAITTTTTTTATNFNS